MSENERVETGAKLGGVSGAQTREIFWWNRYGSEQEGIVIGRKNVYHFTQKYEIQWDWRGAWRKEKISKEEALRIIEANKEKISKEELESFVEVLSK